MSDSTNDKHNGSGAGAVPPGSRLGFGASPSAPAPVFSCWFRTCTSAAALVGAGVTAACGPNERLAERLDPSGYVVEWSHDCRSVTCSGSGTDWFDPAQVAGVDCHWACAEYEGELLQVNARFLFEGECLEDPAIATKGCE